MAYEFRFDMVENVTSTLTEISEGFSEVTDMAGTSVAEIADIAPELRKVREVASGLENQLDDTFEGDKARKLSQEINKNDDEMEDLRRTTRRTDDAMEGLQMTGFGVSQMVGAIGLALGGLGLGQVVADSVILQSQFEATEVTLGNSIGNIEVARDYLAEITDLAASTPFGIQELQDSVTKMVNRGFVPLRQEIMGLGDLAASQGKQFDDLVEALLDAETGEFERLKEFGIIARSEGDKVRLSFKGQTEEIEKTPEAIRAAILAYGDMAGVTGLMDKVSESTAGILSNLQDEWMLTQVEIGEAFRPLLVELAPKAIELMGDLVGWVGTFSTFVVANKNELVNLAVTGVGALAAIAKLAGVATMAWVAYRGVILGVAVAQGIWNSAVAIGNGILLVQKFLAVYSASGFLAAAAATRTWIAAQLGLNVAMSANPIGLIVIGVAAAIAAITYLAYNFDWFREFLFSWGKALFDYSPFGFIYHVTEYLFPGLLDSAGEALSGVMDWFKSAWDFVYDNFIGPFKSFVSAFTDLSFDVEVNPEMAEVEEPELSDTPADQRARDAYAKQIGDAIAGGGANAPGGSSPGGSVASAIPGLAAGESGGGGRNVTITIERLIESLHIEVADMREGHDRIKRIVLEAITSGLNEANVAG